MFREEGTGIFFIKTFFDNLIGQLHKLVFKQLVIPFAPNVFKHAIDVHFMYTKTVKMKHALLYIRYIRTAYRYFCSGIRKLFKPQRNITDNIRIRSFPVTFIYTVKVVLLFRTVNGYSDRQVVDVLLDKLLDFVCMIVYTIG